jgi:hypothetical protein
MGKFIDPLNVPFEFPQSLLKQISECSPDGYMLFYIDSQGEPTVAATFKNSINELGLRSFVTTFVGSINQAEGISSTQEMLDADIPPEDFPEDGSE